MLGNLLVRRCQVHERRPFPPSARFEADSQTLAKLRDQF
jgi:hypothetical protein